MPRQRFGVARFGVARFGGARLAIVAVAILASVTSARADVAIPPSPTWGTPGPRAFPADDGTNTSARPLPLGIAWFAETRNDGTPDPRVELSREEVDLTVLPRLTWITARLVLRGHAGGARAWRMGMARDLVGRPGIEPRLFEVRIAGREVDVVLRDRDRHPRRESWLEWRLDVPDGEEVTVELSFVVPNTWHLTPSREASRPALALGYDRRLGTLYRGGGAVTRLRARAAGLEGRFEDLADGGRDLGPSVRRRVPRGGPSQITLAFVRVREVPGRRAPAWLRLVDDALGDTVVDDDGLRTAPLDRAAWVELVRDLAASARSRDPREAELARGLLLGLSRRVADLHRPEEDSDGEQARAIGAFGRVLDYAEWREEIRALEAWLAESRASSARAPSDELDDASLVALIEAESPSLREVDAAALAAHFGPSFGTPNQLLVASRRRRGADGGVYAAVAGTISVAPGLIALAWLASARRARRSS